MEIFNEFSVFGDFFPIFPSICQIQRFLQDFMQNIETFLRNSYVIKSFNQRWRKKTGQ